MQDEKPQFTEGEGRGGMSCAENSLTAAFPLIFPQVSLPRRAWRVVSPHIGEAAGF